MDLHELFQQRLQKIELLNDFVVLYGRKEETLTDLQAISSEVDEIGSLLKSCADILNKFQHENRQKCQQLIEKSQQQQLRMLDVLEKVIDLDAKKDSQAASNVLPMPNSEVKSVRQLVLSEIGNTPTPIKFVPFKSGEQPVMTLADYMKSPYATKRMRPLALQFTDFEKTITADEFAKIPNYMKGRESLDDVQQFLESVIIRCFTSKYTLLPKRREAVLPMELDLWNLFKSQEEYFRGSKFITQGDICRLTDKQIDKKTTARITILRHLKIVREERKNTAICYIWCKN